MKLPPSKALFTLSPFKVGCLTVLAAVLLFYSFGQQKPLLLAALDNRVTDAMFRWRGPMATSGQIVIVDLDEKSLRKVGQWPWPRHTVARLIERIGSVQPRAIGLDIVFAESDRTSPKNFLDELQLHLPHKIPAGQLAALKGSEALDHDIALGKAFSATPSVLGYVFQTKDDGLKTETEKPFPTALVRLDPSHFKYHDLALIPAYRAIINTEKIALGESEGFFNVFPDAAGTVRKVPLFMGLDGVPYPSLALEMLRVGMGEQAVTIHVSQLETGGQRGLLGVSFAGRFLPTDEAGQLTVNFRGPAYTFPYLSAVDVLEGRHLDELRGKYVLIGTSAAGLLDLRATPFSSIYPGVEVHANIIDNVIKGDPFSHDFFTEIGLTYTIIVVGGLFLSALLAYTSALAGGLGGILLIEATVVGNYFLFFRENELVGVVYPLATVILVFMIVTLFNYFYEGRERRFISRAFGHYVSPRIVEEISKNPEKLTLKGEQKVLTVLFSDIRGFTSISERMSPEELGLFMNEYLTAMSNIIMRHKGTVDKYIGDAVMAIWGAPLTDEEHAANCVRAAFAMMERLREMRPQWEARGLPMVDVGIGINSGLMSVGNFGSEQRFDYTVMGDNVNLASRLEGSNKTYGTHIVVSEYTREILGENFFCRFIDMVRVKGKALPVKIYEPVCEGAPDPQLKKEIEEFEEAMVYYRIQRFDDAERILAGLETAKPAKINELYLERIAHFRENPPPADWDGAFTFTTK
ncbi:MAG: adenylate/guanylate cyclase domain-containing protein [Thermodesulfobacteriota bacterium]